MSNYTKVQNVETVYQIVLWTYLYRGPKTYCVCMRLLAGSACEKLHKG